MFLVAARLFREIHLCSFRQPVTPFDNDELAGLKAILNLDSSLEQISGHHLSPVGGALAIDDEDLAALAPLDELHCALRDDQAPGRHSGVHDQGAEDARSKLVLRVGNFAPDFDRSAGKIDCLIHHAHAPLKGVSLKIRGFKEARLIQPDA